MSSRFHGRKYLLGVASALAFPSAPLLHGIFGTSGFWDEIVSFGLIGVVLVGLAALVFLGGRGKGKGRDK